MQKVFETLNRRMYLSGTTKRLASLDAEQVKKPLFFIIQPNTIIKNMVNAVSHMLLIYTALVVPF